METELKNFIKVWGYALFSISYCYYITPRIKSGVPRLLSLCPVLYLFLVLPMYLSSVHLTFVTGVFLTWLANFKLVLFSFDKGPLIPIPTNLPRFFCFTCFPIKAQQNPKSQSQSQTHFPKLVFGIKVAIFVVLLHLYKYKQNMSPSLLWSLHFVLLYLEIEMILTFVKVLVFIFLGCDIEPQTNQPYLATSLQDFWGRRWNIMVPAILRQAIYNPMRRVSERRMSSSWALFPGILTAFFVSGLVHELLFFHVIREKPTWEVTMFFVLQGVCTSVEMAVKKKTTVMRRCQVNKTVSRLLTVGFVFVSGVWLFAAQLKRSGVIERYPYEALLVVDFFKHKFFILLGIF